MVEKNDAKDEIADAKKRNESAGERDTATPQHPEILPPSAYGQVDSVESAVMRARIESTPGGARYEEEQKRKHDPKDPGPQPGKGREEAPYGDDRKRYIVQSEEKWHFDGLGPLSKGNYVALTDEQAKRAGKNVKLA